MQSAEQKHALAKTIAENVWQTYDSTVEKQHLHKNFYHEASGLHSEGMWHNCMMAISYHVLQEKNAQFASKLQQLLVSLKGLNFDAQDGLFHSRRYTTFWDHEKVPDKNYVEGEEKQLNANLIAVFCCAIVGDTAFALELWQQIVKQFKTNNGKWGKSTKHEYYRAVDHAWVILALAALIKMDAQRATEYKQEMQHVVQLLQDQFMYKQAEEFAPHPYLQKQAGRFVWQENWIVLAYFVAYKILGIDSIKQDAIFVMQKLMDCFIDKQTGLMLNECNLHEKTSWGSPLLRFTGDNALLWMIVGLVRTDGELWPNFVQLSSHGYTLEQFISTFESWYMGKVYNGGKPLESDRPKNEHTLWSSSEACTSLLWSLDLLL